jgi:acyl-CoA synthetase (AMP-forming)/AMP-acid ligase II
MPADDPRRGFFAGYFKNPEATDEAWAEGWFHTGDIVRREADGSMFFVDRKKNVIRRSGENIAAVEVEIRADAASGDQGRGGCRRCRSGARRRGVCLPEGRWRTRRGAGS